MLKEFTSYRQRKQKKINAKMANWREAKSAKRTEAAKPNFSFEVTDDCFEIEVRRTLRNAYVKKYLLLSVQRNVYAVYEKTEQEPFRLHRGFMGTQKAFKLIARDFPKVRRG